MRAFPIIVLVSLFFSACRKEDDAPAAPGAPAPSGPTPLTVDLPAWVIDSIGPMPQPLDNPLTVEGVALGRRLFHDKRLSDNQTISCASCHRQENAFSDPLATSPGSQGMHGTRSTMAIVDLAWSTAIFWDGRRASLEAQVNDPLTHPVEMNNHWPEVIERLAADPDYPGQFAAAFSSTVIDSAAVVKAIAQFERTLVSFGSRFDRYYYDGDATAMDAQEIAGMELFIDVGCAGCHPLGLFTDDQLRNNGVDPMNTDPGLGAVTGLATDAGKFKVPGLRNIAVTAPYMHDGRFNTLFDVVTFYGGHVQAGTPNLDHAMLPFIGMGNFTSDEKDRLIAFLEALTDEAFLTNEAFSAP